jgi:mannose-6-phosphate isomerase-like protein (cupin superfamily)
MNGRFVSFVGGMACGVAMCGLVWVGASSLSASPGDTRETTVQAAAKAESTSAVVLENDRVRVKDARFAPGVRPGMHTHELAHVGVVIEGGTLVFNYPDGKSETLKLDSGGVGYRGPNVTHEAVNTGQKPVRVIEVELK